MEKELNTNKMGTAKMFPLLMSMALPAMLSMIVQALYNVVDSIFVSNYSSSAFTALSFAYPLQMVLIAVAVGTGVGINSLIARRLGSQDVEEANHSATHGLLIAVVYWLIFLVLGLTISRPFISLFTQNQQIIADGTMYIQIILCCSIGMCFQVINEKILQATGNMIVPMITQLTGAIVNIILDPLLIFGIGPFPEMGITGAAIATVFAQIVGGFIVTAILLFRKHEVKVSLKGFKPSLMILKNIFIVGLPAIIMQCIGSIMLSGINAIISVASVATAVKESAVNVFGIYFKLQSFVFMPVFGLNQGVTPIIGFNYGARNKKRMYSALKIGVAIGLVIMTLGFLLFQIFPEALLSMFSADADMMRIGIPALRIISTCFIPAAVAILFTAVFQAVGKGFRSMMVSILRQLVIILPVSFLLSKISLETMWWSFPIAEVFSLLISVLFFVNLTRHDFKRLDTPLEKTPKQ